MTNEDLAKLDEVLTQRSRFLAAVVREHGIRAKQQFELQTVNVFCLCFAVGLIVLPIIAESKYSHAGWTTWIAWLVWAIMWFGLSLFWHEQTTRVAERADKDIRGVWYSYRGIHGDPLIPAEEFMKMTPEQLRRGAGAPNGPDPRR